MDFEAELVPKGPVNCTLLAEALNTCRDHLSVAATPQPREETCHSWPGPAWGPERKTYIVLGLPILTVSHARIPKWFQVCGFIPCLTFWGVLIRNV